MDGQMDGWSDGWMDGWSDGWSDGWMDGWMDGQGIQQPVTLHCTQLKLLPSFLLVCFPPSFPPCWERGQGDKETRAAGRGTEVGLVS